jgi:hypothetical protein
MPLQHFPGEGTEPCQGTTNAGKPCGNREIEGLEFCLHHVPDEYLDEAEAVTGMRRCRHRFGQTDACRYTAVTATEPPQCKDHGAVVGSVTSMHASRRVVEGRIVEHEAEMMAEYWEAIIDAPPVINPLEELQKIAGQIVAWKDECLKALRYLKTSNWRYEKSRLGEQTRAEILIAERALDRAERCLVNMVKLGISKQLVALETQKVDLVERALIAALQASGLDIEGQDRARKVLRRELKAVPA